jgi:hypothetical protein
VAVAVASEPLDSTEDDDDDENKEQGSTGPHVSQKGRFSNEAGDGLCRLITASTGAGTADTFARNSGQTSDQRKRELQKRMWLRADEASQFRRRRACVYGRPQNWAFLS